MSSAKREQPTVLRWDDVVELVRRGNVAPLRRVAFPFPQKGRPAGARADCFGRTECPLVSHTSAAKLLGDWVSGVSAIAARVQEWAAANERPS
jgi:hypothetical protein